MQRIIIAAAVLLVVQLGLIIAINYSRPTTGALVPEAPFLEFQPQDVTVVRIIGGEGARLTLNRNDGDWTMSEFGDAPADGAQITELLERLTAEKKGFAVATTAGAAARFKVAPDHFDYHLTLTGSEGLETDFYVGTSAGFRRSHARNSNEDDIVIIGIGSFDIDPQRDSWLDKSALKRDRDALTEVVFPDFTVTRDKQRWSLEAADSGETLNTEVVEELLESVCGLSIQTIVEPEEAAEPFAKQPVLEFTLRDRTGNHTTYTFAALEGDNDAFLLRLSDRPFFFKIYGWLVNDLQTFDRQKLTTVSSDTKAADTSAVTAPDPAQDDPEAERK